MSSKAIAILAVRCAVASRRRSVGHAVDRVCGSGEPVESGAGDIQRLDEQRPRNGVLVHPIALAVGEVRSFAFARCDDDDPACRQVPNNHADRLQSILRGPTFGLSPWMI